MSKLILLRFTTLLFIGFCFFSCDKDVKPPPPLPKVAVKKNVKVPRFNRDSAYTYIAKQCEFGPRVPNTTPHVNCKNWMVEKLESFADDVMVQKFDAKAYDGQILKSFNIIARFNPEHKKRVLLFAHWDSRPFADHDPDPANREKAVMGADDGASGVGVLIEIARQLKENPIDMGVDILLVDSEDYGDDGEGDNTYTWGLGSQHWSRTPHIPGYKAKYGILLDMVGSKDARFPKEAVSVQYANTVVNKVWKLAKNMGYGNYFVDEQSGGVTDDHFFVNTIAKIPSIDIINKTKGHQHFSDHWHTVNDQIDIIDKKTIRAVGQVVLAVIYNESGNNF